MKLSYAPDDLRTMLCHRHVSENGLVEIGVYRVAYGWRVRAGFVGIWDKDLSPRTGRARKYLSSKDK